MDFVLISDINSMIDQTQITYLKLIFQIPHVMPEQCYCTSSIAVSAVCHFHKLYMHRKTEICNTVLSLLCI